MKPKGSCFKMTTIGRDAEDSYGEVEPSKSKSSTDWFSKRLASIGSWDSLAATSFHYKTLSSLTTPVVNHGTQYHITPDAVRVSHWASDLLTVANSNALSNDTKDDIENGPGISAEKFIPGLILQRSSVISDEWTGVPTCETESMEGTDMDANNPEEGTSASTGAAPKANKKLLKQPNDSENEPRIPTENAHVTDHKLKEDSAVIMQSAIRRYLANKKLLKQQLKQPTTENQEQDIVTASEVGNDISAEFVSTSKDMKSMATNAGTSLDNEDNLITNEADNFVFQASCSTSTFVDELGVEDTRKSDTRQSGLLSTAPSQTSRRSVSDEPVAENEQSKHSTERDDSEQPETENNKTEALGSRNTSEKSISSTTQDVGAESKLNSLSSSADSSEKTQETEAQVSPSECASSCSISSTLGSPDKSEAEGLDVKQKPAFVEKETSLLIEIADLAEDGNKESLNLDLAVEQQTEERQPDRSASDAQSQKDVAVSPEGSPRRHHTAVKSFLSNQNHELGGQSSKEQVSKESKNGKRCSSFGSSRSSNLDQETGDSSSSSSSSSLPHYMQDTMCSRARLLVSPRLNFDMQDKEIYHKKRNPFSGANGKQGIPLMQ